MNTNNFRDEIRIENLEVFAYHGVYAQEKLNGQRFLICASLFTDLGRACESDSLSQTINYAKATNIIYDTVSTGSHNLIEKVASEAIDKLFAAFPSIKKIEMEVKKPDVPLKVVFDYFSIKLTREWSKAYISIGSNLGDRQAYLDDAVAAFENHLKCRVTKKSAVLENKPYGGVATKDFLNMAMEIETLFTPYELLAFIHETENAADRERKIVWGDRTLDLDILFFEDCVFCDHELTIPHIDMENRYFVLIPLAEIAPYYRHPITHKTIAQMVVDYDA